MRLVRFVFVATGQMIWVDVGGGTARNLEFFPLETLRRHFDKVYIVDVSPSLLQASQRYS